MKRTASMLRSAGAIAGLVGGVIAVAVVPAACSSKDTTTPEPAVDSGATPFVYRGTACLYDVAPPERHAFKDLALDDKAAAGAAAVRVRVGLGGTSEAGSAGYADPSRSAVITWETKTPTKAARVRFGQSPTDLGEVRPGYSWVTPAPEVGFGQDEPETNMHEVHLCGLEPGRTYHYQVGGGAPETWSATQSFTTVPASGAVTVGVLGDSRDDVTVWQIAQRRMRDLAPNLQINTGDMIAIGTKQSLYDQWLDAIWKDPGGGGGFVTLGQQMMVMVAGNHENDAARFYGAFAIPGTGAWAESFASFDVGGLHIAMFDDQGPALIPTGEQAKATFAWLDQDLAKANANRAKVPFVLVVHHRGLFTTSNHANDADVLDLRKILAPLYDKHQVDVVLNGHDHAYERSKPLRAGADPRGAPEVVANAAAGAARVYVVNAGAGAPAYGVADAPFIEKSTAYGKGTAYSGCYGLIKVDGKKLVFESFALSSSGADPKIDSFEINR